MCLIGPQRLYGHKGTDSAFFLQSAQASIYPSISIGRYRRFLQFIIEKTELSEKRARVGGGINAFWAPLRYDRVPKRKDRRLYGGFTSRQYLLNCFIHMA